jgi:hypothetical protein
MFGLTGNEGNHGEDVKEYWWYLDSVPSHRWNKWRYHYPQAPFPYDELVRANAQRDRLQPEYELVDAGIFDEAELYGRGPGEDTPGLPSARTRLISPACSERRR